MTRKRASLYTQFKGLSTSYRAECSLGNSKRGFSHTGAYLIDGVLHQRARFARVRLRAGASFDKRADRGRIAYNGGSRLSPCRHAHRNELLSLLE